VGSPVGTVVGDADGCGVDLPGTYVGSRVGKVVGDEVGTLVGRGVV